MEYSTCKQRKQGNMLTKAASTADNSHQILQVMVHVVQPCLMTATWL
jgi:hypothetical protein